MTKIWSKTNPNEPMNLTLLSVMELANLSYEKKGHSPQQRATKMERKKLSFFTETSCCVHESRKPFTPLCLQLSFNRLEVKEERHTGTGH
jgi:hypothetical protein